LTLIQTIYKSNNDLALISTLVFILNVDTDSTLYYIFV